MYTTTPDINGIHRGEERPTHRLAPHPGFHHRHSSPDSRRKRTTHPLCCANSSSCGHRRRGRKRTANCERNFELRSTLDLPCTSECELYHFFSLGRLLISAPPLLPLCSRQQRCKLQPATAVVMVFIFITTSCRNTMNECNNKVGTGENVETANTMMYTLCTYTSILRMYLVFRQHCQIFAHTICLIIMLKNCKKQQQKKLCTTVRVLLVQGGRILRRTLSFHFLFSDLSIFLIPTHS